LDQDLKDELAFHIAMREEQLRREGRSDPRLAARRQFGNVTRVQEECRESWMFASIERLITDVRYARRSLAKRPGFTVVAILTLALGIGANSAVFSAINAILLRPLPFPNADRLMVLDQYKPKAKNSFNSVAPLRLADWNRLNSTFEGMSGYYTEDVSELSGAIPEKIARAWVASRFFQVSGVSPALGRPFTLDEERFGGPRAVVLSDQFWRRRFASDPKIVGKALRIETLSYSIVAVMPPSFLSPSPDVDVWCPSPIDSPVAQSRESTWFNVIGRLKLRVTLDEAQADLATVQGQLGKQYPKTDAELAVRVRPLKEVVVNGSDRSLWILFASVSLLLLIACTNIAALLLARTADAEQETLTRFSLGASRGSIMMRFLSETFLLALAGSAVGLVLAAVASGVFHALARNLPRVDEIRLDWTLVLYTLICAVCVTFLCGLFPAVRSVRRSIAGSLSAARTQVSTGYRLE
jgi:predicted permease